MTVKEVIEKLKEFDENLLVVILESEYSLEADPRVGTFPMDITYENSNGNRCRVFKNTPFVTL